jgi:hypothetical protein
LSRNLPQPQHVLASIKERPRGPLSSHLSLSQHPPPTRREFSTQSPCPRYSTRLPTCTPSSAARAEAAKVTVAVVASRTAAAAAVSQAMAIAGSCTHAIAFRLASVRNVPEQPPEVVQDTGVWARRGCRRRRQGLCVFVQLWRRQDRYARWQLAVCGAGVRRGDEGKLGS